MPRFFPIALASAAFIALCLSFCAPREDDWGNESSGSASNTEEAQKGEAKPGTPAQPPVSPPAVEKEPNIAETKPSAPTTRSKPEQGSPKKPKRKLREGFSYLEDIDDSIQQEIRYATSDNFVGKKIPGYSAERAILTTEAALALKNVQDEIRPKGLSLKVFDAYRPERSVRHFVDWANSPDNSKKKDFYPNLTKEELFLQGYIAKTSGHSRGSSVDLTLVDLKTGKELPMGTPFDYFDRQSSDKAQKLYPEHFKNRAMLRDLMIRHGFVPYKMEWWHFRLKDEPFPEKGFDFVVE